MGQPFVTDRHAAMIGGVASLVFGSWLLHQAYEARGLSRPWPMRFVPGG